MAETPLATTLPTVERRLRTIEDATAREIARQYKAALDDIRRQLLRTYDKYAVGGELSRAEMTQYNRQLTLSRQIEEILAPTFRRNRQLVSRLQTAEYGEAYFQHAWAIDQAAGVSLSWGQLNPNTIRAAVENDLMKIAEVGIRQNGRLRIRRAVTQGLIRGSSYQRMARGLADAIDRTAAGHVRIARTEGQRAQTLGAEALYARADTNGVDFDRVWLATLDARTRPEHQRLDGKVRLERGWHVPRVGWVPGPLQSGDPAFDIHCRCVVRPEIYGYPPAVRRVQEARETLPYQTYDRWAEARGHAPQGTPVPVPRMVTSWLSKAEAKERVPDAAVATHAAGAESPHGPPGAHLYEASAATVDAIRTWTGSASRARKVERYLDKGEAIEPDWEDAADTIKQLRSLIDRSTVKYRGPMTRVEISRHIADENGEPYKVGAVFELDNTSGWSAGAKSSYASGGMTLMECANATTAVDISPWSRYQRERELLVAKGQRYRVVKSTVKEGGIGQRVFMYELEEVND